MRILLRAHKDPFQVAGPYRTWSRDLIGGNAGNLVFSQAAYRLLSTRDARITTVKSLALDPAKVNARFDQVVVPLANAFRPGFVDELAAMTALFERLTIPVVVLGVGTQGPASGRITPSPLDETVKAFMAAVLERSASVGVRGEVTAAYLKRLGFGDDVVEVVGCPSMFTDGPRLTVTRKVEEILPTTPISLNISPYVVPMGPISLDLAARYPNLVYTAQDRFTLELLLTGRYNPQAPHPPGSPTSPDHPLLAGDRTRFPLDPATWRDHLRRFDFSLGTRIHGNIAALLAGVPALVLAHDSRTLELADYHEIPHRLLTRRSSPLDPAELYASADWGPTLAHHAERWERMAAFLEHNGLRHVFQAGESPARFDQRLAATPFPPIVGVGGTRVSRWQMGLRHWLGSRLRPAAEETVDETVD